MHFAILFIKQLFDWLIDWIPRLSRSVGTVFLQTTTTTTKTTDIAAATTKKSTIGNIIHWYSLQLVTLWTCRDGTWQCYCINFNQILVMHKHQTIQQTDLKILNRDETFSKTDLNTRFRGRLFRRHDFHAFGRLAFHLVPNSLPFRGAWRQHGKYGIVRRQPTRRMFVQIAAVLSTSIHSASWWCWSRLCNTTVNKYRDRSSPKSEAKASGWLESAGTTTDVTCCNAFSSSSVVSLARIRCTMCVFGHHPHPLHYLCAKLHFFRGLHNSASP